MGTDAPLTSCPLSCATSEWADTYPCSCSKQESEPCTLLGSTVELTLLAEAFLSHPQTCEHGRAAPIIRRSCSSNFSPGPSMPEVGGWVGPEVKEEQESCPCFPPTATLGGAATAPHLGRTIELPLKVYFVKNDSENVKALPLAHPSKKWTSQGNAGNLTQVKTGRPGGLTSPALLRAKIRVMCFPFQHLPLGGRDGSGNSIGLAHPGQQDLQDTGQQQDVQEESQWGSSIDDGGKTRGLQPDLWSFVMNTCM